MARKFDLLTDLYNKTAKGLSDPADWRDFLESACRNYRLRFDEQLLVFAQRPDATAVLEIERWNTAFGRWVNRGAKGIAVFEDIERDSQRLKYYFDISDTHQSRFSRPVPVWNMHDEYTEDVIDTLENTFGYLDNRTSLEEAILSAAQNAVEDNIPDYIGDLLFTVDNSFLYGLTEDTVKYMYQNLATQSIAYMIMTRLGIDTAPYYNDEDFRDIVNFNTPESVNALGFAVSDIAEMALSEIARTVISLDRENRTFDNRQRSGYNDDTTKTERRLDYDSDHLHPTGGLRPARPDIARPAAGTAGSLRSDETEISQGASQNPVLQSPDHGEADTASRGYRADSNADGGESAPPNGEEGRRYREAESAESSGMDSADEQSQTFGAGDGQSRTDLHDLIPNKQAADDSEPAFSVLSAAELADKMYDYLTDYIIDFYEEQDGEPIDTPDDGVDPVILKCLEYDLFDVDRMKELLDFFSERYDRNDNDSEINDVYDKVVDALNHRISDPVISDEKYVRGDTNLEFFDRKNERRDLDFISKDSDIKAILLSTPHLKATKSQIAAYFESVKDDDRRTEYIKSIFNNDFTEIVIPDGRRMGYKTYLNVLHFWEGSSYNARTAESYFDWRVVAAYFEGMRLLGELRDTAKPLPSVEGQMDLISDSAEEKSSAFVISQEIIDAVLTEKASGVEEGKFRIYEQFQKSLSRDENIRFLKNEYGIGGSYPVLTGTGINEDHNGKGITLMRGFGDNAPKILLKWNQVERRITELIKMGRYLNDREREFYPLWLTKQEQFRAETAEEIRRRKEERRRQMEMETAPEERNTQHEYQYHLGDTVYIGSTGYEILSIEDDRVMLFDPKFPLFNKEMSRAEFDERVQENPLNNSLRVAAKTPPQPESVKTASDVPVSSVDRYFELKAQNPESILLFRIGDFYEIMGDDAVTVSEALDLTLTSRRRNDTERVPMVGFPAAVIDSYTNMLLDRGWNVAVTKENGEVINMVTARDERPVNSFPIARIDYYKPDGSFDDSIEFTNPARLGSAIINESPYEIMSLYLYRDKDGKVVPHSYVNDLPHPLRSFEIVDSPIIGQSELIIMLERAKDLINEFCHREFHHSADFDDLSKVNLAYTETEDGSHEIQSYADLEDFSIVTTVDEQVVRTESYDSLQELVDQGLQEMEFGDLVYVSEEELAPLYEGIDEQKEVDSDEIKLRSVVIDLRPDDVIVAEHIGRTVQIDDRDFQIEDVSERGEVLLRDLTFERETGYPVFRREKADLVRRVIAGQPVQAHNADELIPAWEQQPRTKAQTFDLHPEIPMSQRHTFDLASNGVETVGKKERFNRNINAIRTLKSCQKDNRFATPEEQVILSKYVGWGGIPEAFDENNPSWESEYNILLDGLTEEEYASARASTLTAFYTPPAVISAIYKVMENMGFQRGNILEPSCGIGNFIGMLPASMSESRVFGVEIDTVSAGIAQQLYQKSSIAAQPYEQAEIPDSFFDAVVGNVPFGDLRVSDKRYDKHHFLIHDYFFAKSLDKLRPGGVMALVTSRGTMDKENPAVRKYIAQRADLLGAIRLPNNTFRGNAGTDAVSDILILQKRDRIIDIEPSWVHLGTDENGITMNSYFIEHPEMILGEMKLVSGRFGMTPDCVPYEGTDLKALLDEAVANIHGEIVDYELDGDIEEDNSIPADPDVRNFSFTILDGEIYYRENSRMTPIDISETAKNRIKGMIPIRDCVRTLLDMQLNDYPNTEVQTEQRRLNALYDGFTKKYGLINSRANTAAFSMDSSYSLISALEILDEEGNLERKADIFTKRTIKPHTPTVSVDTASEALAVSMAEKARVDMGYMCELSGLSEEKICEDLKGVIFLNPLYGNGSEGSSQKYLTSDEYLSGNVREKLETARRSAQLYPQDYAVNVEMLEKVQPEDLKASEISVRLGATWLPIEDVQDFIYDLLDTPYYARWKIKVHFSPLTGEWNIENKTYDRTNVKAYSTFGTDRINAYQIIEQTLNLKDVRIYDYIEEPNGKRKPVLNKKETALALAKQENIKQSFQDWIWSDPSRRERVCRLYNDKFNTYRPREYDGSHISFVGMNPEITLREHQRNAVARILYGGNTLLAHAVGAGKTYEMAATAMESKRLGLCNKSLFVVPNHLTEQWAAEFLQLYPAANILVSTKKDFEKKNRRRFCGRIATGDYDAVIIGHSQFEKIPISIERQKAMLKRQLEDITDGILELSENHGDKFTVKQLEKSRRSIRIKLEKLNAQDNKDDVVTFEELGVDRLFVDESHYYKNLYLYTKMRNVGGIAQTEAQKSSDLFMKCRYLDELTGSRGTVFATGTPISNSMVELYTIQRYLQYETLVKNDLQHFDAWASTFGETVSAVELTPEGTGYRSKVRFARFYNLPELMSMFRQVADIQTSDMLELPVPKANYHNIAVKPSQIQKDMVAGLAKRAEKIRNRMVDASVDNMLNITNDGRKLALDQRLLNPILPDFEGSKVNACVQNVYDIWQKTTEKQLTQLLFCDLSTPKKNEFSVYTDIRGKLIARGIPENEIAFIHDAKTEAQKLDLFRKVRRGEVRILLGSTQKMGAGTNAQNKLVSMHDLDCPWRPSDLEQRSGRIIRQGNENDEVDIYRYVTEETFDAYLYQLVESKQKFCSQIMTSKTPVRSAEDVDLTALSYAEIKMLATGNPYIKEKMELDIDVQKLQLIKAGFLSEKYDLEDKILKYYPQKISSVKGAIEGLKENIRIAQQHPKSINDAFVGMEIKGVFYDDKAKAGQSILDACKAMQSSDAFHLGSYRGFDMELYFDTISRHYEIRLKGRISHDVELGTDVFGNITRLDNVLEGLEKRLELMESDLENIQKQYETAKVEVKKPFPQEEELRTKTNRLNELNALLDMDRKDDVELFSGETVEVEDDISDRSRSSRDER